MQLLVVHPTKNALPEGATDALADIGWQTTTVDDYRSAIEAASHGDIAAALVYGPDVSSDGTSSRSTKQNGAQDKTLLAELVRHLQEQRIAALMVSDQPAVNASKADDGLIEFVGRNINLDELRGRLAMIRRYHGLLRRIEGELDSMSRLGHRLKQHFDEVEQEMHLAGRLQRDFLPDCSEPIGPARYAAVFRPASWVSGDIFDIVPVDEHHTAVYVADAVGHGLAAGLLTMFINRAITPKVEENDVSRIVSPSEILAGLNEALADQELPNCQFVTAVYALFDHRTLRLQCAGGGHPPALHIGRDGTMRKIEPSGGLLGLFKGERFELAEVQLEPGDKVLFHTDGVELAFQDSQSGKIDPHSFERAFASAASLPVQDMLFRIVSLLNDDIGSLQPNDDITIVGMEIIDASPG
jgi:phosphoserine phosphatase RsbU/P